ncbi:MAG: acyl carrier protein [Anaerolineales bacterium]|nr:acyl carrier protein [Anaerolineales bacterium]
MEENKAKIYEIVANTFGLQAEDINDTTSPDNVEMWDSVEQIMLVSALEQYFGIEYTPEDIMEMLNVGLIVDITQEKL